MKKKVRKQLVVLFLTIVLVGVFMIVYVTRPFISLENNNSNIDITNENKSTADSMLPNGHIDIENMTIQEIASLFNIEDVNPFYEDNILNLYSNNLQLVNDLDFSTKILLVTSSNKFKEEMEQETELKNYLSERDNDNLIHLSIETFDNITEEILGNSNKLERDDFYYCYKYDDNIISFKATFEDNYYIFEEVSTPKSTIKVYQKLVNSLKIDNMIYLQYKVIFSKNDILYFDKNMSRKINDSVLNVENYMSGANGYQFGYQVVIDENNEIHYSLKEVIQYYIAI